MKKISKLFLTFFLLFTVSACGYEGKYRYSCQDPENWEKKECSPPICEVDGACTKTLLGWDPSETSVETIPVQETVVP